jgi:hypothetical protein
MASCCAGTLILDNLMGMLKFKIYVLKKPSFTMDLHINKFLYNVVDDIELLNFLIIKDIRVASPWRAGGFSSSLEILYGGLRRSMLRDFFFRQKTSFVDPDVRNGVPGSVRYPDLQSGSRRAKMTHKHEKS